MCADPSPAYPPHSISASEPAAVLNLLIFQPTPRQLKVLDSSFSIHAIHIHLEHLYECLKLLRLSRVTLLYIQQAITSTLLSKYISHVLLNQNKERDYILKSNLYKSRQEFKYNIMFKNSFRKPNCKEEYFFMIVV